MLSLCLFLGALFLGVCFIIFARGIKSKDNRHGVYTVGICFCLFGCLYFILNTTSKYSNQVSDFTIISAKKQQIDLFEKRTETLSEIIKNELSKYPSHEEKVFEKINPQFLLKFPELKANETIRKSAKDLMELNDDVFNLKDQLIELYRVVYLREISPWTLWVKHYQDFFGEKNPIAVEQKR